MDQTLLLTQLPLIPVRRLNDYVYCPRRAYMEWVQGEMAVNADVVDGLHQHRRVDKPSGPLPENPEDGEIIHARSVSLSSLLLGIIGKLDLVEGEGTGVVPVDYKRGKRPHVAGGVYDPERVQLCAQGLLLREHGYHTDEGVIYFCESRERVRVPFDEELIAFTRSIITELGLSATSGIIPMPLEDSPKCPRCSLVGICLPDEVRFLSCSPVEPRPIVPAREEGLPVYVQSSHAYIRKDGDNLIIEVDRQKVAEARLGETSQLVLYGNAALTTPALHECLRREIPITWHTYGGWFVGHTVSTGHHNVETRTCQYRASFEPEACLKLARRLIAGKIANCRTLLRRNWRGNGDEEDKAPPDLLIDMQHDVQQAVKAASLESLLGIEGAAAARYFQRFSRLLKNDAARQIRFDFSCRNRRPPRDPVNAMLSFAYAMLTREWTVALSAVGLDPYRGFYHQPRFGRPSLALDMMEPFRPLVADSAVLMVINNGEIHPEDFITAAGSCNLTDSGRKRFIAAFERRMSQDVTHPIFRYRISYRRLFEVQARLLIRSLSGEIPGFPVFVTR